MIDEIKKFKEYIESIAKQNFYDYDAVEYLEEFSYVDYDDAINRIKCGPDVIKNEPWEEIFTESEMLKAGVMYACIVTGAIKSELTAELFSNWKKFMTEHAERTKSFFDCR